MGLLQTTPFTICFGFWVLNWILAVFGLYSNVFGRVYSTCIPLQHLAFGLDFAVLGSICLYSAGILAVFGRIRPAFGLFSNVLAVFALYSACAFCICEYLRVLACIRRAFAVYLGLSQDVFGGIRSLS
jgi:hypothetical protein